MSRVSRHLLPDTAEVVAGRLSIGGCDVHDLATTHGTPLFVYDEAHLRARCAEAVREFGVDAVVYATKAFLCTAMARLAHEEGLLLDVATGGELFVARNAGVPASRCVVHGNNKSTAELREAMSAGVRHIVALRGDPPSGVGSRFEPHPDGYRNAADLVRGIRELGDFEVSVSAYPERHPESVSIEEDLAFMADKADHGAFDVVIDTVFGSLAADSGFLDAAKRRHFIGDDAFVDAHDAVLQRFADAEDVMAHQTDRAVAVGDHAFIQCGVG